MRQAGKGRKKFQARITLIRDPGRKIPEKKPKIRKIKKPLSSIIPSQNGMRSAWKQRQKFQSRIPFIVDPVKKIRKKIAKNFKKFKKPLSDNIQPKRDEMGREREKKNLVPNSVHTRPGQENFEKFSKKIQKNKKRLSSIISGQNGMRQAEKE